MLMRKEKPRIKDTFIRIFDSVFDSIYYDMETKEIIIYGKINVYWFMYVKKLLKYSNIEYTDLKIV